MTYKRWVKVENLRAGDSMICLGTPRTVTRSELYGPEPGTGRSIWRVYIHPPYKGWDLYALYGDSKVLVTRNH